MKLVVRRLALPLLPGVKGVTRGARGLDKISVSLPVRAVELREDAWREKTVSMNRSKVRVTRRKANLGIRGYEVMLTEIQGGGKFLWIQITPAYVAGFGSNVDLPGDESLVPLVSAGIEVAQDLLGIQMVGSLQEVRVTRLDLAVNLRTAFRGDMGVLFAGLQSQLPPYARFSRSFTGSDGTVTTVKFGNKTRFVILYDKHLESGGQCPAGTIRWECRLRRDALRRYGIDRFGDATPARIAMARRQTWEWAGMDYLVTAPATLREMIRASVDAGSLKRSRAVSLLGTVLLGSDMVPRRTRQRHQQWIRDEFGLTVDLSDASDLLSPAPSWVLEVDYNTGEVNRRPV